MINLDAKTNILFNEIRTLYANNNKHNACFRLRTAKYKS
ncbi:hypothetical protein H1P_3710002 [Hyella patelloides LEGE 07179]|uniref:Uncharacterized protein n=1 Tax=Hyella patelloides LEGE 07179 TaxID=945734 RepID=A0A563VWG5_9CYAN|nr:hypothetical protein H1P_3710002 [Hyella patelloides LEGE 07179]